MVEYGYIYGLIDPENQEIFYIGKTINPKVRLSGHTSPSNLKKKSACIDRLNLIINHGNRPILKILLKCKFKNINRFEKMYITKFKKLNPNLTNERSGGEGWNIIKKRRTEKVINADELMMKSVTLRHSVSAEDTVFKSVAETAIFLEVMPCTISSYLKGRVGHRICKGYYIRYTGTKFIEPKRFKNKFKYLKHDINMILLRTYNNINEVVEDGYDKSNVYMASRGSRRTAHGFIWKREEY